ncbi:MAG: histidine kinase [Spirochaetaceae bacterium]
MVDEITQDFFKSDRSNKNDFQLSRMQSEFVQKLRFYTITNPYLKELIIVDTRNNYYNANKGSYNKAFSSELVRENIRLKTLDKGGGLLWSITKLSLSPLLLSRQINAVGDFEHPPIGIIYSFIDIEKLIHENLSQIKYYGLKSSIYYKGELLYSSLENDSSNEIKLKMGVRLYQNIRIEGKSYFVTNIKTEDRDWEFLFLVPTEQLIEEYHRMNRLSYLIYFALFILFTFLMIRSSKYITSPIISLSREMKAMDENDFVLTEPIKLPAKTSEEVSQLHHEFYQMIYKIDTLVNKNLKQQLSLNQSQLEVLSNQLNPHFLYNTLDSLYWMAEINKQPEMAGMVKSLSSLLRHSLNKAEPLITIKEQLDILNNYFYIQKIRFKDRLEYTIDVDFQLYTKQIPRFTLQPLVENSIKYSLEEMNSTCLIEVSIKKSETAKGMDILIRDNGPGFVEKLETPGNTGIGLANLKQRISLIYGTHGNLKTDINNTGGTDILIYIPLNQGFQK